MNLSNNNDKKSKKSGIASLFGRGSVSKIGKSQFPKSMGGIMERLKGLSRKDLALVGVGLSVLVAAPVAEYMISKPADSANMLTSGFSSRDAQGASALASLYEPGINALSQGSADGSGEVITPLSARDPYALILGAQPEQPAMPDYSSMSSGYSDSAASSSASSVPSDYNDLRDSVKDSAKRGAAKAVQNAGTPTVIKKMSGHGSSFSFNGKGGGASGSRKISAPEKANVGAKQSKMVNPVSSNGFKGATNTPNSVDSSAADRLRAKANAQGGYFSGASAVKSADAANAIKMNDKLVDGSTGSSYDGQGFGKGTSVKDPSKNNHNNNFGKGDMKCTTLACEAAKQRQQAALKWEEYLKYDLPKKFIELGFDIGKTFLSDSAKKIGQMIWNEDVDGVTVYYCIDKKDPNEQCVPSNMYIVKSSKKSKTYTDDKWMKECGCGRYSKSELPPGISNSKPSANTNGNQNGSQGNGNQNGAQDNGNQNGSQGNGNQNGAQGNGNQNGSQGNGNQNGAQGNNDSLTKEEVAYDTIIAPYDETLKELMGQVAKVRKDPSNGVGDAKAAVNTYTVSLEAAFGGINNHIIAKAKEELKTTDNISQNIKTVGNKITAARTTGKKFKEMLDNFEKYPAAYLMTLSDGSEQVWDATQAQKIASDAKKSYTENYVDKLNEYNNNLNKQNDVLRNLVQHINISKNQVDTALYTREYKETYRRKASGLREVLDNPKDPKVAVNTFLEVLDGAPAFPTTDAEAAALNGNSVNNQKMSMSPAEKADYPTAKAREWRGLPATFGTSEKEGGTGTLEERFKKETTNIRNTEKKAWLEDSPLNCNGDECKPKDTIPNPKSSMKMRTTEFYAPGYRIFVEIPIALGETSARVSSIGDHTDRLEDVLNTIAKNLHDKGYDLNKDPKCVQENSCTRYGETGIKGDGGAETHVANQGGYTAQNKDPWLNGRGLYYDVTDKQLEKASPETAQAYNTQTVKVHSIREDLKKNGENIVAVNRDINYLEQKQKKGQGFTEKDAKDLAALKNKKINLDIKQDQLQTQEYEASDEATYLGLQVCLEAGGKGCFNKKVVSDHFGSAEKAQVAYNNWKQNNLNPVSSGGTGNTNNGTSGNNAGSGSTNTGNSSSKCKIPLPPGVECPPDAVINPDTGQHLFTSKANKSVNMEGASKEASSSSTTNKDNERQSFTIGNASLTLGGGKTTYSASSLVFTRKHNDRYVTSAFDVDSGKGKIRVERLVAICGGPDNTMVFAIAHLAGNKTPFRINSANGVKCEDQSSLGLAQ